SCARHERPRVTEVCRGRIRYPSVAVRGVGVPHADDERCCEQCSDDVAPHRKFLPWLGQRRGRRLSTCSPLHVRDDGYGRRNIESTLESLKTIATKVSGEDRYRISLCER